MTFQALEIMCIKDVAKDGNNALVESNYDLMAQNVQYADYFNNIETSINKAIARIVATKKTPSKSIEVEHTYDSSKGKGYEIAIPSTTTDIYSISNVLAKKSNGEICSIPFTRLGKKKIYIENYLEPLTIIIKYYRTIPLLTHTSNKNDDLEEIYGIDDNLAITFILNLVKSDLFETEEPALAQNYRTIAEQYLANYQCDEEPIIQNMVDSIYTWY